MTTIKTKVGKNEVLASGVVILHEGEDFEIELPPESDNDLALTIKIDLQSDESGESGITSYMQGSTRLGFSLKNFKNPRGDGISRYFQIGSYTGRPLMLGLVTHKIAGSITNLTYTILLGEQA